jgi:hypothetical protein
MSIANRFKAFVSTVAAAAGAGRSLQPKKEDVHMNTNSAPTISATGLPTVLQAALTTLERFSGPEVEKLKASVKVTVDDAVAAAGPIAAQIFNAGIEAIPGVKLFAAPIELVADPIVSGAASNLAQRAEAAF